MITIDLQPLMCKASDALYKKYLQTMYGLRSCVDDLTDSEIEDLFENASLLKYISKNDVDCCDTEKLIETLK